MTSERIRPPSLSITRNSHLRENTMDIIQTVVNRLHAALPVLTPTHLNMIGALGVSSASALLSMRNGDASFRDMALTALSIPQILGSTLMDVLDGTLARTLEAENPGRINFDLGQLFDVLADQTGEKAMAFSRAVSAHKRQDRWGEIMALIEAVATSLPSLTRAYAETKGHAVPETGRGLVGITGTRVGRVVLEIASTVFPEVHKVPLQLLADGIITVSSIITAADRLKIGLSMDPATLSPDVRKQAETRFKALALFTGLSLGATIAAYYYLRHDKINPEIPQAFSPLPEKREDKDWYITILSEVENYCHENNLEHRFVGGTLTDLIGPQTSFDIDIKNRTIRMKNHQQPTLKRKNGTIKDVDLVLFTSDHDAYIRAKKQFIFWQEQARRQNIPFPLISVEAARHADWPKRSKLKQFVTAFEAREDSKLYLAFGNLEQEIGLDTVDGWNVVLDDGTLFTTFHPYAHALSYLLRMPSGLKPKDKKIIGEDEHGTYSKYDLVSNLAKLTFKAGEQSGIDYWQMFQSWMNYAKKLLGNPDLPTFIKAGITEWYWNTTIGTDLSQGAGPLGSLVAPLSNQFSG